MKTLHSILLFLLVSSCFAQNQFRFTTFTVEDGLSQNSINDIFQDSDGFMWFATQDGLNQFDGYSFKHYNSYGKKGHSLCDNFLWGIEEDKYGYIWVCSRSGLNRINKNTGEVTHFLCNKMGEYRAGNQSSDVILDDNFIYVSYNQNKQYKIELKEKYSPQSVQLDSAEFAKKWDNKNSFYSSIIHNNVLYLACENEIVSIGNIIEIIPFPDSTSKAISQSNVFHPHKGVLWVGLSSGLYYLKNGVLKNSGISELNNQPISSVTFDQKERLWAATKKGVYVVDFSDTSVTHIINKPNDKSSLVGNYVHTLFTDKSGLVWIGTANNGLQYYDPEKEQFKYLNLFSGLNDDLIWSTYQDSKNNLWVGTNNGLNKIRFSKNNSISSKNFAIDAVKRIENVFQNKLNNKRISCFTETPDGNIWVGTSNGGLYILNPKSNSLKNTLINNGKLHSDKYSELLVYENEVWGATQNGVFRFNFSGELISEKNIDNTEGIPPDGYFLSMYEDLKGTIWLGSNYGICYYNSANKEFTRIAHNPENLEKGPAFNFVTGFYDDGKHLWMSTFGGGVSKLDREKQKFVHYAEKDGLANNVCSGITGDDSGNIWVSTNKGISCISASHTITNYTKEDGLIYDEFAIGSFHKNKKGELFFGTAKGLVAFNPKDITQNNFEAQVKITRLNINYEPAENIDGSSNTIHLYPTDKVFSVEFAGLNFKNSHQNQYAYTMQGYDNGWVFTNAKNRKATYSNLPAGEYVLKIKTANDDGVWSNKEKHLKIIVHPPFWATWWFISLSCFAVLLVVVMLVKYISQRKLKAQIREMEVKQKIQQERSRISKDLHDNIGSQITYIISSLDNAAYKVNSNGTEVATQLNELSDFSRNTMQQLRETIWVINKDVVKLQELKEKTSELINKFTEHLPINASVEAKGNNISLNPTVAITAFRITQEAFSNAIKHAKAENITIVFTVENDLLTIEIKDDGAGGAEEKNGHFGLKNMRARAKEIGGNLLVKSGSGTSIEFQLDLVEMNKIGHMPH